jgi:threonine dehydrogenase-like Zn-dependent dehydrogenase
LKIPEGIPDEKVLFLTDIFPTGYMAAENCNIRPGDTVAVWGCGPVGQFAIRSAKMLGAERVIAIDRFPERLRMAREEGNAETIDYTGIDDVFETLTELTGGRGPDCCIDAVGMEAHGTSIDAWYDRVKQAMRLELDRSHVLRQILHCCRKGGTVSIPGVYAGFIDKVPFGAAFGKGLTLRMGQTHVQNYTRPLLTRIESGEIDPSFVITHRVKLEDAPRMYQLFRDKADDCIKVVMEP